MINRNEPTTIRNFDENKVNQFYWSK